MLKRSPSPGFAPPAKRLHSRRVPKSSNRLNFSSLYDELILCVLSYLSHCDLCIAQSVCKHWARLAEDNGLWKSLYVQKYGRTRLRGSKGFISRQDGRDVRPLPSRLSDIEEYKDWKWMFRISSNWKQGRCLVESLVDLEYMLPSVRSGGNIHLILAGPLTIVASSQASDRPTIFIFDQYHRRSTLICEPASSRPVQIAALALNQAPPVSGHQSVVCCLSTGELYTFSFSSTNPSSYSKSLVFQPSLRSPTISNIIRAAYYHPLLVILADSLSLFIYDLSSGHVQHTQTLTTFTCYPPTSLVLSSPSALLFKVVITYGSPVYPQHWSVGATEIMISKVADKPATISNGSGASLSPLFKEEFRSSVASAMIVMSTRSIRAFDVPKGWIDTNALLTMREQWGRKVFDIAAAQTDGKWVVLAPGSKPSSTFDHSSCPSSSVLTSPNLHSCMGLQLYRLILPAQSNPAVSTSPPKLNFVRMLHGHTSMVAALTVADGRCISLGKNGSIWVWDLEVGSGTEVAPSDENVDQRGFSSVTGMISFDERRIVTVLAGKVVVRRFDI